MRASAGCQASSSPRHPTLINLGFEWHIDGDANRNARVDVSYRKRGDMAWRAGLPLLRLHGEQVYRRNIFNLVVPNLFAGSIVDLESDTTYEARFVITNPDGIRGPAAKATTVLRQQHHHQRHDDLRGHVLPHG